jgi:hypothetical protein
MQRPKKKSSPLPSPETDSPAEWLAHFAHNQTSYSVYHTEFGVLVAYEVAAPSGDIGALAKHYSYLNLPIMSTRVPRLLGMYGVTFCKSVNAEDDWLAHITEFINGNKESKPSSD